MPGYIAIPLGVFVIGLFAVWTGLVFYRSLTKNGGESARLVAGQSYMLIRAAIALLTLAVIVGLIQWILGLGR